MSCPADVYSNLGPNIYSNDGVYKRSTFHVHTLIIYLRSMMSQASSLEGGTDGIAMLAVNVSRDSAHTLPRLNISMAAVLYLRLDRPSWL